MKKYLILFFFPILISCAPKSISNWKISCGVDKGAIKRDGNLWIFKTSENKCKGGTFKQRAEIKSKTNIPLFLKASYNFQSIFKFKSNSYEKFDIFQIHDGRDGCAPPLKVTIFYNNIYLFSDYKIGPGEKCIRDIMDNKFYGNGSGKVSREGKEHKLNVILNFDGKGGFEVQVYLDDKLTNTGEYVFEENKGYTKSKHFYFKHGVYSKNVFDYTLISNISMNRIDFKALDNKTKNLQKKSLNKSNSNLKYRKKMFEDNLKSMKIFGGVAKHKQSNKAKNDFNKTIKIGTLEAYLTFLKKYENDSSAKFHVNLIKKRLKKLKN